jgi:hypothetical protein
MSDSYHYEDGAKHYDHKKVLHIDKLQGADLQQLMRAFFKDDAEEAEVLEEVKATNDDNKKESKPTPDKKDETGTNSPLYTSRQEMLDQLLALADKGGWLNGVTADAIKTMMQQVLQESETLWQLLEKGRGDRVRIVWQNLIGYFVDRKLLPSTIGAPALNKMFFGDDKGYTNIDKGRPSKGLMTADFESLLPLLDTYVPKV